VLKGYRFTAGDKKKLEKGNGTVMGYGRKERQEKGED